MSRSLLDKEGSKYDPGRERSSREAWRPERERFQRTEAYGMNSVNEKDYFLPM